MTVAELIETLKEMPQDLPVQYLDHEEGPSDVDVVEHHTKDGLAYAFPDAVWLR